MSSVHITFALVVSTLASACLGGQSEMVAGETVLGPSAVTLRATLEASGHFTRLCFALPQRARVDIGTSRVLLDGESIEISALLLSEGGAKMNLAFGGALLQREREAACLWVPDTAHGLTFDSIEAHASHPITVSEIWWYSNDKG